MQMMISNDTFFANVEAALSEGNKVRIRVKGISMLPMLRNGIDEVVLTPINNSGLKTGGIYLFRFNGRHVLHRLIGMDGNMVSFKGDNTTGLPETCAKEDVVGVVTEIWRRKPLRGLYAKLRGLFTKTGETPSISAYRSIPLDSRWWMLLIRLNRAKCRIRVRLSRIKHRLLSE